jgi:hypothetical protein
MSLPLKLHPLPNMAKGSMVSICFLLFKGAAIHVLTVHPSQGQLGQASELISQSVVPKGRADLSTVIAFVNKNILPAPQDLSAKAKDFAWFALRPITGAHVRANFGCRVVVAIAEELGHFAHLCCRYRSWWS